MKAKFEITKWLSENRETIISKYDSLKSETFFQGQSLKDFMMAILNAMLMNSVKSEKRASSMLPFLMGNVYFEFSNPSAHLKK
jgi:hypothetical protein